MASLSTAALLLTILFPVAASTDQGPPLCRSVASGRWSQGSIWGGGKVPPSGSRVQIRSPHVVTFDTRTEAPIRSIHIAGTLRFDPDRDTRLDVGLIKIQAGDDASENGFDCDAHAPDVDPNSPRPALEVGTTDSPIPAGRTASIRLVSIDGMDAETC